MYEARLGNTRYTLEQEVSGNIVISRFNVDGVARLYIPERLILDYVRDIILMKRVNEVTDQVEY